MQNFKSKALDTYIGVGMAKDKNDTFVGIAIAVGGTVMVMVLFVVLFAKNQAWVLAPISSAIAIMGIGLGYLAAVGKKKKRR